MPRHLEHDALLAACQAGRGVLILVEGETDEDDAWFYNRWFESRGPAVTFWAQNGHAKVKEAVAYLRKHQPGRRIYGLRDRDYADDAALTAQEAAEPADGLFRTRQFTLENHLLDPYGWDRVVTDCRHIHSGSALAEVTDLIESAYRECIPLAAFNYALRVQADHDRSAGPPYRGSPDGVPKDVDQYLAEVAREKNSPLDLPAAYRGYVARLQGAPIQTLEQSVSGKWVLPHFLRRLHLGGSHQQKVGHYMANVLAPPPDLDALITHILDLGGKA